MDTDISPIFNNNEPADSTPIFDIHDEQQQPIQSRSEPPPHQFMQAQPSQDDYAYHNQPQQQQQQPDYAMHNQNTPPLPPRWDPFASIGVTSWVVLAIIFIIGFIVGKLR